MPSAAQHFDDQTLKTLATRGTYARARALTLQAARADPVAFNALVLRDEKTGKPIEVADVHKRWHEVLDEQSHVVMWSFVEAGKTSQISIGRSLWELGNNPGLRIAVVSNAQKTATKIIRAAGQYIERSPELHSVFPHLRPAHDPSLPWSSEALTVMRPGIAKDPSYQACGVHGNIIGSRVDLLILDDILSPDNTSTEHRRDDVWQWVQALLVGRLSADARVWIVGNAWHPRDLMHRMEKLPRYKGYRYPVMDPVTGELSWPERWPLQRIENFRLDNPVEFERVLMCRARAEDDTPVKEEWINTAKDLGEGYSVVHQLEGGLPDGYALFHGVDLASRKHEHADLTAIVSILVHPDGKRQLLRVKAGRMTGPEIIAAIEETHQRLGGIFIVENNAAQQYILQFAHKLSMATCMACTTGRNKVHPHYGLMGLIAELAAGKWIIPNDAGTCDREVDALLGDMRVYSPRDHVGDRLMALWFARQAAVKFIAPETDSSALGLRVVG